jgi:hypothetical protein
MIFKKGQHEQFTIIDNQAILDGRLSAKAKGILLYLMSRPDDWQVYESEIKNHFTDGIASIKSGVKELINIGYISRAAQHDHKGRFSGYEYLVYDKPQNQAILTISRLSVNGQSHTTNIDETKDRYNIRQPKKDKLTKQEIISVATYDFARTEYLKEQV